MRRVGVVTVARSDYGIYLPVLRRIMADPQLELRLFVSGAHLSPEFGLTVRDIEAEFEVHDRIEMLLSSDTPEGMSKSIGLGVTGFAQAYAHHPPDILLALGDRFEMHAAALAALPFKIPVAHLHGGELSQGAIDDSLRHSMTKLSHLHFVSTKEYARRVIQMGEEPWRVFVCGAPSLDNLEGIRLLKREEFADQFGIGLEDGLLLVTFHPVTLEHEKTEQQVSELLAALRSSGRPVLFTAANADMGGRAVSKLIGDFIESQKSAHLAVNLGTVGYFSAMKLAAAMVGNSSSGMIEAASFELPVVNIGSRQEGRIRGANVIDAGSQQDEILDAISRATSAEFRAGLRGLQNPYNHGGASEMIVNVLKEITLDERIIIKRFYDLPLSNGADSRL